MNFRNEKKFKPSGTPERGGTVLIVTIWIVLVLAGLVLVFARSMRVEAIASANFVSALQADSVAKAGAQYVLSQINTEAETQTTEGGLPYEALEVGDGFFWVLRPNLEDDREFYFGIADESAKINLNSATLQMLLKLPNMTAELAAAIVDWRDEDSEVSAGGAENEYYLLLSDPYNCKNAPFETIEEVLLLKGATLAILFGEDMNRNGVLDENENDAAESEPGDNSDGHLDRGIFDYVTVYSTEENVSNDGRPRVNVNDNQSEDLRNLIREIIKDDNYFWIIENISGGRPYQNIIEFYYTSRLTYEEFEQIADRLTTSDEERLAGRVNINTAPREVLLCLAGLEDGDVDDLIAKRLSGEAKLDSIAWVVQALDREKATGIGGDITTHSAQYSGDVVGVSGNGRAYKRYRLVVDTQSNSARILYWKPLNYLGWPLDPEILSTLRSDITLAGAGL
jgi:type II secretory pathway component PulK